MLEIERLEKRFGGTIALDGLSLRAAPGEIVGIAGPNGAGKSTLIHVLAGEILEDGGAIAIDGTPASFGERPRFVSVVHQELQLFPTLTVLENLLIGADGTRIFRPRPTAAIREVVREFGLASVANRPLDSCSLVVQQLTEIARAMLHRQRIILLDEPNSALTTAESDRLFKEVTRLREQGRTIILLVSHRLADLQRYCDRVLVVREGSVAAELVGPTLTTKNIARTIVGGLRSDEADRVAPTAAATPRPDGTAGTDEATTTGNGSNSVETPTRDGPPIVSIREWTDRRGDAFRDVDLIVRSGEAVFITGQEDGGGRELLRSIAGLRAAMGTVDILPTPSSSSASYLPGSRASSLFPNLSVRANLCARLAPDTLGRRSGLLRRSLMTERAEFWVDHLEIRTATLGSSVGTLSGGTQQKVALGAALAARPRLLIVEEPTRGVDVRTREQIVETLRRWVGEGNAILGFSPELDEVFEIADTVRVAVSGRLTAAVAITPYLTLEGLAHWVDEQNRASPDASSGTGGRNGANDAWETAAPPQGSAPDTMEQVRQQP